MPKQLKTCVLSLVLLTAAACSGLQSSDSAIAGRLERQITETNQKIDEIYHRLSVIQFMADNHEKAIRDLQLEIKHNEPRPAETPAREDQASDEAGEPAAFKAPVVEKVVPDEKASGRTAPADLLYKKALAAHKSQNYPLAMDLFYQLANTYPNHELADNALYWAAESLYAEKKFAEALNVFKKILDTYPNGSKVPDALLKTGYCYLSLNDAANAKIYLKKVTINYPFSEAGIKAAERLKNMK